MNERRQAQMRKLPQKYSQTNKMNTIRRAQPPSVTHNTPTHTRLDTCSKQKSLRGQTKPSFSSLHCGCSTLLLFWLSTSLQQYICARGSKRGPQMSVHSESTAVVEGAGRNGHPGLVRPGVLWKVVVVGGEWGLKLLLPAGNKYLNYSVLTSNMCYIALNRARQ